MAAGSQPGKLCRVTGGQTLPSRGALLVRYRHFSPFFKRSNPLPRMHAQSLLYLRMN